MSPRNLTLEQAFALENMKLQAKEANKLLIRRSKPLLLAIILSALSAVYGAFQIIPGMIRGDTGVGLFGLMVTSLIQLLTILYFLRAKDAIAAAQVLRLLAILYGLQLFFSFSLMPLQPHIIVLLLFIVVAQGQVARFRYN